VCVELLPPPLNSATSSGKFFFCAGVGGGRSSRPRSTARGRVPPRPRAKRWTRPCGPATTWRCRTHRYGLASTIAVKGVYNPTTGCFLRITDAVSRFIYFPPYTPPPAYCTHRSRLQVDNTTLPEAGVPTNVQLCLFLVKRVPSDDGGGGTSLATRRLCSGGGELVSFETWSSSKVRAASTGDTEPGQISSHLDPYKPHLIPLVSRATFEPMPGA